VIDLGGWVRADLRPDEATIMPPGIETTDVRYAGVAPNRLAIAKTSSGPTASRLRNTTITTSRGSGSATEPTSPSFPDDDRSSKDTFLTNSAISPQSPRRPLAAGGPAYGDHELVDRAVLPDEPGHPGAGSASVVGQREQLNCLRPDVTISGGLVSSRDHPPLLLRPHAMVKGRAFLGSGF
jgi:hypothetical protein